MGKEGEDGKSGLVYYPFDLFSDSYRIVCGEPNPPMSDGYKVSDKLIQNAMDYLEIELIQNGSELIDSTYEDIIPVYGKTFPHIGDSVYDCNSLYTKPYDLDISNYDIYRVYIGNAWFNDDV